MRNHPFGPGGHGRPWLYASLSTLPTTPEGWRRLYGWDSEDGPLLLPRAQAGAYPDGQPIFRVGVPGQTTVMPGNGYTDVRLAFGGGPMSPWHAAYLVGYSDGWRYPHETPEQRRARDLVRFYQSYDNDAPVPGISSPVDSDWARTKEQRELVFVTFWSAMQAGELWGRTEKQQQERAGGQRASSATADVLADAGPRAPDSGLVAAWWLRGFVDAAEGIGPEPWGGQAVPTVGEGPALAFHGEAYVLGRAAGRAYRDGGPWADQQGKTVSRDAGMRALDAWDELQHEGAVVGVGEYGPRVRPPGWAVSQWWSTLAGYRSPLIAVEGGIMPPFTAPQQQVVDYSSPVPDSTSGPEIQRPGASMANAGAAPTQEAKLRAEHEGQYVWPGGGAWTVADHLGWLAGWADGGRAGGAHVAGRGEAYDQGFEAATEALAVANEYKADPQAKDARDKRQLFLQYGEEAATHKAFTAPDAGTPEGPARGAAGTVLRPTMVQQPMPGLGAAPGVGELPGGWSASPGPAETLYRQYVEQVGGVTQQQVNAATWQQMVAQGKVLYTNAVQERQQQQGAAR